jgi:transposase-like protein
MLTAAPARRCRGAGGQHMSKETRHSREFWNSACEKFEKSGLTRDSFARSHGLSTSSLRWWIAAFKRERQSTPATTRFLPVEVAPDSSGPEARDPAGSNDTFEIVLVSGTTVRVPAAAESARLKDLLRAVVEAGC